MTVASWRNAWTRLIPFRSFPKYIRRALYTIREIVLMNYQVKKVMGSRGYFPNDDAVFKLTYLGLRNAAKKWTRPIQNRPQALQQCVLHFDGRVPAWLD